MKYLLSIVLVILLAGCGSTSNESHSYSNLDDLTSNLASKIGQESDNFCNTNSSNINWDALLQSKCKWLSSYNLFTELSNTTYSANDSGLPFELNSTLFTDYSKKNRLIFIPENTQAVFNDTFHFEFPIGTTIVKIFSLTTLNLSRIVEVRVAIKRESGWIFLPYVWSHEHNNAFLHNYGLTIPTTVDHDGINYSFNYEVPDTFTCTECHKTHDEFHPIGPKARHLNKSIRYNGQDINQLVLWKNLGLLNGLPANLNDINTAPDWRDSAYPIQDRAKAYLDINCAHCHSDGGAGALSGLRLEYWRGLSHTHGVCNSSHGWRGGGFDIWPGWGEISSIPIRMRHTEPKDRMPPIGRNLVDEEAAQLVSDWIDTLPYETCAE